MQQKLPYDIQEKGPDLSSPLINRLNPQDSSFHDWYRFVLSFPAHVVRDYVRCQFELKPGQAVLDPFCGTGTTVVESRLLGMRAFGIEANPVAHFASLVKVSTDIDAGALRQWGLQIAKHAGARVRRARSLRALDDDAAAILLTDCIGAVPLHKVLILREAIEAGDDGPLQQYGMLALAKTAVQTASNLHFGPEVGVRGRKLDAPVIEAWLDNVLRMATDLETVAGKSLPSANVICGDARSVNLPVEPGAIDAVFTSPPYPNEKDYTRTTRLESVLLRFLSSKQDLRELKQSLIRSNTRNVYKGDVDHTHVVGNARIDEIADAIERRRLELGKTSGFEKLYARVTKLYFGGMARHLEVLRPMLRPGARLGYMVGDQASYLRVHIPTGSLLAELATSLGYTHVRTDLFRTRLATATKQQIREEIVVLRWDG